MGPESAERRRTGVAVAGTNIPKRRERRGEKVAKVAKVAKVERKNVISRMRFVHELRNV